MTEKIGIVGFSFGLRAEDEEPNPSNVMLANAIVGAYTAVGPERKPIVVVTQWEITKAIRNDHHKFVVDHSVELRPDGTYLDSKGVWEEAKAVFAREGVTSVVVVGQPFLHLPLLKRMVEADPAEYSIISYHVGSIPFDDSPSNTQPWTRTKLALLIYAIKSLLPSTKHGHAGMQQAT